MPTPGSALSPWQHLPQTQILVPPIPIGQGQAHGVGFALSAIGSLVWGTKKRPLKKQRDGLGLGLRWPRINNDNQQSTDSWQKLIGEMFGWRRVGGRACGGTPSHLLVQLFK